MKVLVYRGVTFYVDLELTSGKWYYCVDEYNVSESDINSKSAAISKAERRIDELLEE